jgi:L-asparaginase II
MPSSAEPLIRVERGGVEEAFHLGHVVVADAHGEIKTALGNAQRLTYFRSCAKPFQAIAALQTGIAREFDLQPQHIAIMAASHNGEPRHLDVVRDLQRRAAVPEDALRCGAHWPYYEPAAAVVRRTMTEPIPIFNNCSGKHSGMLAAARVLDAPLDSYLQPEHPVQQRIRKVVEHFTGCRADEIRYGIDGCSAPNAAVPLRAMARSFAALVQSNTAEAADVVSAMTGNPFLVGGTDRFDTTLMEVTRGRLLAKGGAAGAQCTANRQTGEGLALKLDSGDGTWVPVAVTAALQQLGWLDARELDALKSFAEPSVRNYRRLVVGSVRPVFELPVTAV